MVFVVVSGVELVSKVWRLNAVATALKGFFVGLDRSISLDFPVESSAYQWLRDVAASDEIRIDSSIVIPLTMHFDRHGDLLWADAGH